MPTGMYHSSNHPNNKSSMNKRNKKGKHHKNWNRKTFY